MSYSTKTLPNKPYEFPAPPLYAVWVEERGWDYSTGSAPRGRGQVVGQIRHCPDLKKARKRVLDYCLYNGGSQFNRDWSIYKWDGIEYVLQYEGRDGGRKSTNTLFQVAVKDLPTVEIEERPGFEDELEAALRSIASAAQ